jgi:hypothetical protein
VILERYAEADAPPIDTPEDKKLFDMMKTAYETCKAVNPTVATSFVPMRQILTKIEKLFPVTSQAYLSPNTTKVTLDDANDFQNIIKYMEELGMYTILWEVNVYHDDKDNVSKITAPCRYRPNPQVHFGFRSTERFLPLTVL